jgi:hypothetical protein
MMTTAISTLSQRLRSTLSLVTATAPLGVGDSDPLWTSPRLRVLYPRYLVSLHALMRTSVALMAAAREAALRMVDTDPVAQPLADYMEQHIAEEADHDTWLLNDLELLGVPRQDVLSQVPSAAMAGLVGAQYYYIHHYRPVALLGYLAVFEGNPPTRHLIDTAAAWSGFPEEAFRTLRFHGDEDPHHKAEIDALLDTLPLDEQDVLLVITNAMATAERALMVTAEIVTEHPMTLLPAERARR